MLMLGTSAATVICSFTLGVLAGWLTGQSGPEPAVTAAVLPAILTLSGTLVFTKKLRGDDGSEGIQAVVFIVVFSAAFYTALGHGVKKRNSDLTISARKTYETHMRHLQKCFEAELVVNTARRKNGLSQLPVEYFCRTAP